MYIDLITYGYQQDSICTYVLADSTNNIKVIIYEYYGSIQLLEIGDVLDSEVDELNEFLLSKTYKRVSGTYDLVNCIKRNDSIHWKMTYGYIMKFDRNSIYNLNKDYDVFFAKTEDFEEIAKLICMDPGMGNSYDMDNLRRQLIRRYEKDGCGDMYSRIDNRIVSHFASYAIIDDIAVLSGMITDSSYRNEGLGSVLVRKLSSHVSEQNKDAILYCYDREYDTWYEKLGYRIVEKCAKLELLKSDNM